MHYLNSSLRILVTIPRRYGTVHTGPGHKKLRCPCKKAGPVRTSTKRCRVLIVLHQSAATSLCRANRKRSFSFVKFFKILFDASVTYYSYRISQNTQPITKRHAFCNGTRRGIYRALRQLIITLVVLMQSPCPY